MAQPLDIPIFPLPNVVHFPHTELRLHVFEPRYRKLVADLGKLPRDDRLVGIVLISPSARRRPRPILSPGTAARLVDVEPLQEGRSNILLTGIFRFDIHSEIAGDEYRRARVGPKAEPPTDERSAETVALRQELTAATTRLRSALGERFPITDDALSGVASSPLEDLTKVLCARLDLLPLIKLQLLSRDSIERARLLLSVLGRKQRAIDLLHPYRATAAAPQYN